MFSVAVSALPKSNKYLKRTMLHSIAFLIKALSLEISGPGSTMVK